jgi:hypothetical protein
MESCCICLDPPHPDNSLYLISCGCQGAWFHEHCQNMWINTISEKSLSCPICRRDIPFKITYDFSHPILRLIKFLYVFELFLYYDSLTPIIQGTAVLAFPFMLPCSRDFTVFATHYSVHSILDMFFLTQNEQILFRYLHLIILATYINHIKRVDPFTQFVRGRTIIYSKSLEYSEPFTLTAAQGATIATQSATFVATQGATNATEGNKPRRSGRRKG